MSKVDAGPIGVFDSGVGGLSVVEEIHRLLPHESLVYIADSENAPYGSKSAEFIRKRVLAIAHYLKSQSVKAIVIACNTATAAAAETLRNSVDIPVIAMEPAVKPGAELTRVGLVGVLATEHMLHSQRYQRLLNQYGTGVEVIAQACPGLVEAVEQGRIDAPETRALLQQYLTPLIHKNIDTLVLGCTHYPFLKHVINDIIDGREILLVDTGVAVARQLRNQLAERNNLSPADGVASWQLFTTGNEQSASAFLEEQCSLRAAAGATRFESLAL